MVSALVRSSRQKIPEICVKTWQLCGIFGIWYVMMMISMMIMLTIDVRPLWQDGDRPLCRPLLVSHLGGIVFVNVFICVFLVFRFALSLSFICHYFCHCNCNYHQLINESSLCESMWYRVYLCSPGVWPDPKELSDDTFLYCCFEQFPV